MDTSLVMLTGLLRSKPLGVQSVLMVKTEAHEGLTVFMV